MKALTFIAALLLLLARPAGGAEYVHVISCWNTPPSPPSVANVALLSGAVARYDRNFDTGSAALGWHEIELAWTSKTTVRAASTITALRVQCPVVYIGDDFAKGATPASTIPLVKSIQVPATGAFPKISVQVDEPSAGMRRMSIWRLKQ